MRPSDMLLVRDAWYLVLPEESYANHLQISARSILQEPCETLHAPNSLSVFNSPMAS